MKQALSLKNTQLLSLTPQLKQSLKLLQLSSLDLEQEVQQVLETNPLLERDTQQSSIDKEESTIPVTASCNDHLLDSPAKLDWQQSLQPRALHGTSANSQINAQPGELRDFAVAHKTLFEHLNSQIQVTSLTKRDKLIATTLLRSLNKDGYLSASLSEIKDLFAPHLKISLAEINTVLSFIKSLDPIGVGAGNLQQRLLILLADKQRTPQQGLANLILRDHLPLLAKHKFEELAKQLNCNQQELATSIELITTLNPRIASRFSNDNENHISPDVTVNKLGGKWVTQLNIDRQINLRTNQGYADLLKTPLNKTDSDYIQQHILQANIFISSLRNRYQTMLLVASAIVERQQDFFEFGAARMQPLVLQDIAALLDLHESTISRATAGKYLRSPHGTYELKYFFNGALSNVNGGQASSTAIRHLVKQVIDGEKKSKPLSDSKIVSALEAQGQKVARRTVAKYRESLKIPPASQRKVLLQTKNGDIANAG